MSVERICHANFNFWYRVRLPKALCNVIVIGRSPYTTLQCGIFCAWKNREKCKPGYMKPWIEVNWSKETWVVSMTLRHTGRNLKCVRNICFSYPITFKIQNDIKHCISLHCWVHRRLYLFYISHANHCQQHISLNLTSWKALLNSPPGAIPSCSVSLADILSSNICIMPLITPLYGQ